MTQLLIVDDSEVIRTLIVAMLSDAGYHVLQAATSEEGFRIVRTESVALILCDFSLRDGVNGIEFLRRATAMQPGLKCILMSGSFASGNTPRLSFPVIGKPFDIRKLSALIAELLDGKSNPD